MHMIMNTDEYNTVHSGNSNIPSAENLPTASDSVRKFPVDLDI